MNDTDFWKGFRISPTRLEDAILGSVPWVTIVVLSPLVLLILESAAISLHLFKDLNPTVVFQDLSDRIFTLLTLAILLAGLIFVLRWRVQLEPAFRSLVEGDLVRKKDGSDAGEDRNSFLQDYQGQLHSKKRFIVSSFVIVVMLLISAVELEGRYNTVEQFITLSEKPLINLLLHLHRATRWVLAPVLWGGFGGLVLWIVAVTNLNLKRLTVSSQLRVHPMHPDGVGGYKPLGNLLSDLGLIIFVFSLPLAYFGISGTLDLVDSRNCLDRLAFENRSSQPFSDEELANCLHAISRASQFGSYNVIKEIREIQVLIDEGEETRVIQEKMLVEFHKQDANGLSLSDHLMNRNRLAVMMVGGLGLLLLLAAWLILAPYWAVHRGVMEWKEQAKLPLAQQAMYYADNLRQELQDHLWEEAQSTGGKLELVQLALKEVKSAPVWPIRRSGIIADWLLPSLISVGLSAILTRLSLLISPEGTIVLENLIRVLSGT